MKNIPPVRQGVRERQRRGRGGGGGFYLGSAGGSARCCRWRGGRTGSLKTRERGGGSEQWAHLPNTQKSRTCLWNTEDMHKKQLQARRIVLRRLAKSKPEAKLRQCTRSSWKNRFRSVKAKKRSRWSDGKHGERPSD